MPEVLDDTQKNGVENFHRSIKSRIESYENISSDRTFILGQALTIQCQKWIIYVTLIIMHPGQQFGLNISHSPSRMILAQCSGTSYKFINPKLSITVFDTVLSLQILYILGNTQTG